MCVQPRGVAPGAPQPADGAGLVIVNGCSFDPVVDGGAFLERAYLVAFELTADGLLVHSGSGKCVQPQSGGTNPAPNTPLVLRGGCDPADPANHVEMILPFASNTRATILRHTSSGLCFNVISPQLFDNTQVLLVPSCDPFYTNLNVISRLPGTPNTMNNECVLVHR